LATPLITKADGTKFGKTESGTVWLDSTLTSPYAFSQFWLNADDRDVVKYLKVFSLRSLEEIDAIAAEFNAAPHTRVAQKALAELQHCNPALHATADGRSTRHRLQHQVKGRGPPRHQGRRRLGHQRKADRGRQGSDRRRGAPHRSRGSDPLAPGKEYPGSRR